MIRLVLIAMFLMTTTLSSYADTIIIQNGRNGYRDDYWRHQYHRERYMDGSSLLGFGIGILGGLAADSFNRKEEQCQKIIGYDLNKNPITKTVNCSDIDK